MKRSCKWAQVLLKLRPEEERTALLHAAEKLPAFLMCPRRSKYPRVALGSHTPPESTLASCLRQTGIYASALKESLFWGWIASFILPIKIRNVHFSCVFVVGVFLWHSTDLECWILLNADTPLVLWVFWQRSHTALKPWIFSFPLNRDFIPSEPSDFSAGFGHSPGKGWHWGGTGLEARHPPPAACLPWTGSLVPVL